MKGREDGMLERFQLLSDREPEGHALTMMDRLRGGYYRTRATWSGAMLEVEAYPMLPPSARQALRRVRPSSEAQKALNQRKAERRFRQLAEINFADERDYYFTGTIEAAKGESLPTLEQAEGIFGKFVRKVNRRRKKMGMENAKYLAVIEGWEEGSRMKRLHIHCLMEGGIGRDEMESLWSAGRAQCRRLIKNQLDALCGYLLKDPRGRKRWKRSRGNLKEPRYTYADHKLSARTAWLVARDVAGRSMALERLYPGYRVEQVDGREAVEVRTNPYVPGAYIYARLRRIETAKERKERDRRWRKRGASGSGPSGCGSRPKGTCRSS